MIPLDDARRTVFEACPRLPAAVRPAVDSVGCVLAADVSAAEDVPPFANSAVDGYAVRAADVAGAPVELPVVHELAAGAAAVRPLEAGEAIRIMTGAPVPDGADAIVMVEDTERLDGGTRVRIGRSIGSGDAVRAAGSDVPSGALVFRAGTEIRPAGVGVLASLNHREVSVIPRPRVAVLSTGDELVEEPRQLQPGEIRESNRVMLLAAVNDSGFEGIDHGIVRDDEAALEAALRRAIDTADAVVTSGGVSMGDYDVVKAVLNRIADMTWMQIAIKPAKPFAFGLLTASDGRRVPIFGLPGNPVSSLVSFELLARPALRQMAGHTVIDRPRITAVADEPFRRRPDGKTHFVRVRVTPGEDGRMRVRSTGDQGSHQLASTASANGIAVVPEGDGVAAGDPLEVILLHLPGI